MANSYKFDANSVKIITRIVQEQLRSLVNRDPQRRRYPIMGGGGGTATIRHGIATSGVTAGASAGITVYEDTGSGIVLSDDVIDALNPSEHDIPSGGKVAIGYDKGIGSYIILTYYCPAVA